jgi:hypothetical protein
MASANGRVLGIEPAGRATRPRREYWRTLLEECRRSEMSQAEFCRRRGIPPGTLGYWKCILAREVRAGRSAARSGSESLAFLPVRMTVPPPSPVGEQGAAPDEPADVEIVLAHGRRIRVCGRIDPQWLGQVVAALDAPRC